MTCVGFVHSDEKKESAVDLAHSASQSGLLTDNGGACSKAFKATCRSLGIKHPHPPWS